MLIIYGELGAKWVYVEVTRAARVEEAACQVTAHITEVGLADTVNEVEVVVWVEIGGYGEGA